MDVQNWLFFESPSEKSAKKEALLLLPNDKAMIGIDKIGIIDDLIDMSKRGVAIKIICPVSEINSKLVIRMTSNAPNIRVLDGMTPQRRCLLSMGS